MERVLGLADGRARLRRHATRKRCLRRGRSAPPAGPPCTRCSSGARRTGGREPPLELAERHAVAAGLTPRPPKPMDDLAAVCWTARSGGWLRSPLRERIAAEADRGPRRGAAPARGRRHRPARLDRPPGRARGRPATGRRLQDRPSRRRRPRPSAPRATRPSARSTPSPSPSRSGAAEVEVAYVFLERPDEPALTRLGPAADGGRPRRARGDDRPDRPRRVPGRRTGGTRLVPLPRLSGATRPLLRTPRPRASSAPGRRAVSSFRPSPTSSSSPAQ